jgi:serine/threonine-protein kinase
MTPERWQRLQEVFHAAADLDPPQQAAYLEEACGGDAELRREAEALLAARPDADELAAGVERVASSALAGARLVGARLGPYRVVKEVGQGGMGRVYLAYRDDDQFQRRVAVKLADGAQAPEVQERFRSERRILAALDHPNIARLLDGGTTEDGVPYLVLEYVEGEPIDRYCDVRQLGVEDRVQIFRTVCSAVHYAHQNLVVHRDLKPPNVLATPEGVPKLLDFGIAKLLRPELLGQAPALTTALHRPMTPEYASPEQVRGETVTTASDVYSLGVLLYELLTGCRPLRLEGQGSAIERIVSEVEPDLPSKAALKPTEGTTGRTPAERSRDRGTTPERLRRQLAGDLDNIVMMALRKAPARRYASAEQLAEDLRRTADGLPVRARKDTVRYRVRKFVGRNRYGVGTALLFLALVVGFGINRAEVARDLAKERDRAQQEAATARRVAAFLEDVFRSADPTETRGNAVTAREILDRAAERLGDAGERPEVRGALLDSMGSVYHHLGIYSRADPLLQEALAVRGENLGEENLDTASSLLHLGELRTDEARYAEGEDLLRRALRVREKLLGASHAAVAEALYSLGLVLRREGKSVEAESVLRRAIASNEATLADGVPVALGLDRLALVLEDQGRLKEAEAVARRAVEIARRRLGDHHVDTARCVGRLGSVLSDDGDYTSAEPLIHEALETRRRKFGADHPTVAFWLEQRANLLRDRGSLREAEPVYREALAIAAGALGDDHYQVASVRANLAELLLEQGQVDEAETLFTRSFEVRDRLRHDSLFALASREGLAGVAAARGDLAGAEATLRQILAARRRSDLPPGLPLAATVLALGEVLRARDQAAAAEPFLREALDLRLNALSAQHKDVAAARGALGASLLAQRRYAEAEPLLVASHAGLRGRAAAAGVGTQLVHLYEAWGRPEKADAYRGVAAPP